MVKKKHSKKINTFVEDVKKMLINEISKVKDHKCIKIKDYGIINGKSYMDITLKNENFDIVYKSKYELSDD